MGQCWGGLINRISRLVIHLKISHFILESIPEDGDDNDEDEDGWCDAVSQYGDDSSITQLQTSPMLIIIINSNIITNNTIIIIFLQQKMLYFNVSRQHGVVLHYSNKNATFNKNACFTESQKQRQRGREPER